MYHSSWWLEGLSETQRKKSTWRHSWSIPAPTLSYWAWPQQFAHLRESLKGARTVQLEFLLTKIKGAFRDAAHGKCTLPNVLIHFQCALFIAFLLVCITWEQEKSKILVCFNSLIYSLEMWTIWKYKSLSQFEEKFLQKTKTIIVYVATGWEMQPSRWSFAVLSDMSYIKNIILLMFQKLNKAKNTKYFASQIRKTQLYT